MAYAALVSLHHTSNSILNHDKYLISVGEREQITSIHEYVIYLISFLDDLPEKANRLEGKIRSLANEAEDLIEHIMRVNFRKNWGSFELSRVEVEHQLKRVREEIGSITGDVMDYRPAAAVSSSRVAGMPTPKIDVVIGLDDDLLEIRSRLCGLSSKLQVIPIVGMGGIGKTTLAQKAYGDPLIMDYFDVRVWLTVSPDYSVDEILSNFRLIVSMELFEKNESMAEKVYKSLKGRRYLIVMDDIWSTDSWDDMRYIFPDDNNGSRIMLTTRLSDVATYTSCGSPVHEMKFMDDSQSWNLLRQKVFRDGQDCPLELEDMGKAIAKSCRGLALAVVLVAGILSTIDKSQASWEEIKKNLNSVVDEHLEKILSLSYRLLPHHLRPCFLFMAGFPEDHTIRVSSLIKLWVAEGFLRCEKGYKSLEEEAEEYVEDLVKRNLLLITTRKSNEKIKSCRLHDLVRDMCIRKAQEEKFLATGRYLLPTVRKDERRISVGHSCLDEIHSPTIHTILCFKPSFRDHWLLDFVVNFRLLRVLDVMNKDTRVVPPQVFELFHLRYLALRSSSVIPATISNLVNLQTLIIQASIGCESQPFVSCLPMEIWRMQQLRHLVLSGYHELPIPARGLLPLLNLQTLVGIPSLLCGQRILKMIPNIKKLGIICHGNEKLIELGIVRYVNENHHGLHNLVNLRHLEKLKITMSESLSWQGSFPAFPSTLKKLTLVGGRIPWENMTIVGSLRNLEILKLKDDACDGDKWVTSDGEFPELKFLLIEGSGLKHWMTESIHFPRLKHIILHRCLHLQEIPDSLGEIPTLERIEVDSHNVSLVNSVKIIQEDQRGYGNDALQVQCIQADQIEKMRSLLLQHLKEMQRWYYQQQQQFKEILRRLHQQHPPGRLEHSLSNYDADPDVVDSFEEMKRSLSQQRKQLKKVLRRLQLHLPFYRRIRTRSTGVARRNLKVEEEKCLFNEMRKSLFQLLRRWLLLMLQQQRQQCHLHPHQLLRLQLLEQRQCRELQQQLEEILRSYNRGYGHRILLLHLRMWRRSLRRISEVEKESEEEWRINY